MVGTIPGISLYVGDNRMFTLSAADLDPVGRDPLGGERRAQPLLVELDERTAAAWDDVLRRAKEAAGDPEMTPAPWDMQWLLEKLGTIPDERWPKERARSTSLMAR